MQVLYNDTATRRIIYCGYDMKLSRIEYKIFCCIWENGKEYISADQIIQKCYVGKKPQKGDIAAHICHINRKSRNIERVLIVSKYGVGYRLTDHP
ncbi:MAG: hypothetical protein E7667_05670 [Ruminococcaceae bacterium]|nr:hypothetical protein [Oscillospiraceae bacterium]